MLLVIISTPIHPRVVDLTVVGDMIDLDLDCLPLIRLVHAKYVVARIMLLLLTGIVMNNSLKLPPLLPIILDMSPPLL